MATPEPVDLTSLTSHFQMAKQPILIKADTFGLYAVPTHHDFEVMGTVGGGLVLVWQPIAYTANLCQTTVSHNTAIAETKKERLARLSRQKMYASWQLYNQKLPAVKEVIQQVRPQYRLYYQK